MNRAMMSDPMKMLGSMNASPIRQAQGRLFDYAQGRLFAYAQGRLYRRDDNKSGEFIWIVSL
jgi:hypothetical protein